MKLGLDIDDTLTATPDLFRDMCAALIKGGSEVWLITGTLPTHPTNLKTNSGRKAQVAEFGFEEGVHYTGLRICHGLNVQDVAVQKAWQCQKLGVDLLVDDNQQYIGAAMQVTNAALFLRKAG